MSTYLGSSSTRATGFMGRVQVVLRRLVEERHIARIARAAPVPIVSGAPAVQDRLVLALIISAAKVCLAHWMYVLQRPPASVYALSSVCSFDEFMHHFRAWARLAPSRTPISRSAGMG